MGVSSEASMGVSSEASMGGLLRGGSMGVSNITPITKISSLTRESSQYLNFFVLIIDQIKVSRLPL